MFRHRVPLACLTLLLAGCGLLPGGGADPVHESEVEPSDLALPGPTYAVATPQGLLLRAGDVSRVYRGASTVEWLPGGRALVYFRKVARLWDPETGELGGPHRLSSDLPFIAGEIKRSVTQVDVTLDLDHKHPETSRLAAFDLDLERKWRVPLPGPDNADPDAGSGSGFDRGYQQGHTIDGTTYLMWSDYDPNGEESEPHYGLLQVGPDGEVLDQVQVNERITSVWLSADGAALLALRRPSGHPCGGCEVELELVELDPATGEVVGEYGMPDGYDASWRVVEVDKVGDRVAVRFDGFFEPGDGERRRGDYALRGTWVRDDDGWSLLEGSKQEITWWQSADDRVVARPADERRTDAIEMELLWLHGDQEEPIDGALVAEQRRRYYEGVIPGQALPPE